MIKKIKLLLIIFILFSCSSTDKNTEKFFSLAVAEKKRKEKDPERVFNLDPAIIITTLPNIFGNFKSTSKINDYEYVLNGSGYSKKYIHNKYKKGYTAIIYTYHSKQEKISANIDDSVVILTYNQMKTDFLNLYDDSKIILENTLIYTAPNEQSIKIKEVIFEYYNILVNKKMRSYVYFGTTLDSYFRIKISYDKSLDLTSEMYNDKEEFIRDFAYYMATGMSVSEYETYKKSKDENPIKMQRINNF